MTSLGKVVTLPMSEDDLLRTVLDMARALGVRTAHFRPARKSDEDGRERWVTPVQGDGKGFPDLVLAGPVGVLFRELKSASGRLSQDQVNWIDALRAAGTNVAVWRPADLRDGRVEREIRAISATNRRETQ